MSKLALVVTAVALGAVASVSHAAGDAAAGQTKAAACAGCHGSRGEGVAPNPKIAGMPEDKFVAAMKEYRDGIRANPIMKSFAVGLSDQDFADLAAFYVKQ
jgi:cytochrome c553